MTETPLLKDFVIISYMYGIFAMKLDIVGELSFFFLRFHFYFVSLF